jgi:hypothetical protein
VGSRAVLDGCKTSHPYRDSRGGDGTVANVSSLLYLCKGAENTENLIIVDGSPVYIPADDLPNAK